MDCEKCSDLLGDFLDGTLAGDDRTLLSTHLDECLGCACVRDEIRSIVSVAAESREHFVAPPNERALWLRVRNTIEAELTAQERSVAAAAPPAGTGPEARSGGASATPAKRNSRRKSVRSPPLRPSRAPGTRIF